jgi:hypothetical protein
MSAQMLGLDVRYRDLIIDADQLKALNVAARPPSSAPLQSPSSSSSSMAAAAAAASAWSPTHVHGRDGNGARVELAEHGANDLMRSQVRSSSPPCAWCFTVPCRHHASSRCPQRCWLFAYSAEACTLTIRICFPPLQAEGAFADAHCVRDRAPSGYARPHVPPTALTHQCAKPTARWSAHSRALSACTTVHHDTSDHLCAPLTGTGGGCCRGVLRRPARCVRRR